MCLFVFRARGIADRLHALDIGIRDIRQILNPLRDIRHALNRREVQAERPSRPEKICAVIRRQVVKRPRGERQFARRHVRHDLVVRGASDLVVRGASDLVVRGASDSSRARLRLTHLCRADQPNHVRTVVSSTLEISPVDVVLMWY